MTKVLLKRYTVKDLKYSYDYEQTFTNELKFNIKLGVDMPFNK